MDIDRVLRELAASEKPIRHFRENVDLELTVEIPDGQGRRSYTAKANDLSRDGIGVSIPGGHADSLGLLASGRQVLLEIRLDDEAEPLAVNAEVVWVNGEEGRGWAVGLRFNEPSQEAQDRVIACILSQLVDRHPGQTLPRGRQAAASHTYVGDHLVRPPHRHRCQ